MSDNVKDIIRAAQSAEIRGDQGEAVNFLRQAASLYEAAGNMPRAEQMRRHAQRLEAEVRVHSLPQTARPQKASLAERRGPALADAAAEAWCSFCGRPGREAGKLVAGPAGAFICGACASEARQLVDPPARQRAAIKVRKGRPRSVRRRR